MDIESLIEETRAWSETAKTCGNSFVSAAFERAANAMESLYSERNELFQMNVNQAKTIQKLSTYKEAAEKQEPFRLFVADSKYGSEDMYPGNAKLEYEHGVTVIPMYAKPVPADKPAVAVPDGWKLVPLEITDAMVDASGCEGQYKLSVHEQAKRLWSAMLAAAPSHSQQIDQGA